MPTHGQFRYQDGEPYYYYDVRAEVNHNGEYKLFWLMKTLN